MECQDLNYIQHLFINKLVSQGDVEKWIAVGDRNQSIYAFAGAYSGSFDLFLEKENVVELPLDISYRCSTKIVEEVNKVYPGMVATSDAEEGIVKTIDDITEIEDYSLVVCRNTRPLIDLYFDLIALNRSVYIKGKEIRNSIIKFLTPYKYNTLAEAESNMVTQISKLSEKQSDEERFQLFLLRENFLIFRRLKKNMGSYGMTVDTLINKIKVSIFDTNKNIALSTIHKSKGLESEVVYFLNRRLIPSKFATKDHQRVQEKNLDYVARSRAKKQLIYLNYDSEKII